MMYLLFREHHIMPGQFIEMLPKERQVVTAFMHYELKEREEAAKE